MTFEELIRELESLDKDELAKRVATKAAKTLEAALSATLAAGTSPDGKPWALRKKDGGRPFAHAASRLSVKAYGNIIRASVDGPEVYGHFGAGGAPVRQMLPEGTMPPIVADALEAASDEVFAELTK